MISARKRRARRSASPTGSGQWVQGMHDLERMLSKAGAPASDLDFAAAWMDLMRPSGDYIVRMPLSSGHWSAWIWRKPEGLFSMSAIVPTQERPADAMPRKEFFRSTFPKHWITAARASTAEFSTVPLKVELQYVNRFRVGFPAIAMLLQTDDARHCGIGMVRNVDADAQVLRGVTRHEEEINSRKWVPIDKNILGAALLWHKDQTRFANYRFCRMVIGQWQAKLRKHGISLADDEITAELVMNVRELPIK